MAQDDLDANLHGLSRAELREVVQHLCGENENTKPPKETVLDFVQEIKSRPQREARSSESSSTPASITLVDPAISPPAVEPPPRPRQSRHPNIRALQDQFAVRGLAPLQMCGRCMCWFTESHNTRIACSFHPGRVYFQDADYLAYVPTFGVWDRRYVPSSFRWTCCSEQVGLSAGCAYQPHVPGNAQRQAEPPASGRRRHLPSYQIRTESTDIYRT
ncbi:hypothetical protein F5B20DRAFT_586922 [Whalleya microplaca]|nr:hypothetical protein F5B20DRAFT_586922 [Whalleya microplaca]